MQLIRSFFEKYTYLVAMKKWVLILCLTNIVGITIAQTNLELVGNLIYTSELSDVWGYVDSTGIEYALVGVNSGGTSIVSLENPSDPKEVYFVSGPETLWRDIKTWNKHSYTVNDYGGGGIQILDLSSLPDTDNITVTYYETDWSSAHNIFIDERGYAYVFGANRGNKGLIILDLSNPKQPIEIGAYNNLYIHDGVVRNDTLYACNTLDGFFSIMDVRDPSNPILISTQTTPSFFSHNIWFSDNGKYAFTTDEKPSAYIAAYNVSDVNNIIETDRIKSKYSPNEDAIVHNTHFLNDYLITSYYTDGVIIHDASRPNNLIEIGHFDTSPFAGPDFNGCWGVYPFLPSGRIIATDIEKGLFVFKPTYKRGAYLEGTITDYTSGMPLNNVSVDFESSTKEELSSITGFYGTGSHESGSYIVSYSKEGYATHLDTVNLINGQLILNDVRLKSLTIGLQNAYINETAFNVFPNPTRNGVYIDKVKNGSAYKLFNTNGLLLKEDRLNGNYLNTNDLQKGVYVVVINKQKVLITVEN